MLFQDYKVTITSDICKCLSATVMLLKVATSDTPVSFFLAGDA